MPLYHIEVTGSGCTLDVFFNEYHLYSSKKSRHSFSANIRAWMEKQNMIRFQLSRSAEPFRSVSPGFTVSAVVVEGEQERRLANMVFPTGLALAGADTLPFDSFGKSLTSSNNLQFVCDDSSAIIEKPWRNSQRLIGNPLEVYQLYTEIQNAVLAGDIDRIMALSRARISFGAKIFGTPRSDQERRIRNSLVDDFAERPLWKSVQRPEEELTLFEYLPGKLARVLDKNGRPPLRTVADADGIQFGYDVTVAMTDEGLVWIL